MSLQITLNGKKLSIEIYKFLPRMFVKTEDWTFTVLGYRAVGKQIKFERRKNLL